MTRLFPCPYLNTTVELSAEREQHIATNHPGTLPDYWEQLQETLANPYQIRGSERDESALLFSKWFASIRTGRHLVAVTVSEGDNSRHWIVTAYTARKLAGGQISWQKS
jgi:hypothetical protein